MSRGLVLALLLVSPLVGCEEPAAYEAEPAVTIPEAAVALRGADEREDEARTRGVVVLVPLKSFPADLLDTVETTLARELDVEVRRHAVEPLPREAWYAPRKRYRADVLIEHLARFAEGESETTKVLGLTEVDISTTKGKIRDWGIFGLGYAPGPSAVVSSFRLKGKAKNRAHVRTRVGNVAVHEVGHTFGLPHCSEDRCPMQDAEGSIRNTDTSQSFLGPKCQAALDELAPLR